MPKILTCFIKFNIYINIIDPRERALFLKEENSKLYRVSSYYIGTLIIDLPILLITPILFDLAIY